MGDVSCAFSQSSSQSLNLLEQESWRIYLQSSKNSGFDHHNDGEGDILVLHDPYDFGNARVGGMN